LFASKKEICLKKEISPNFRKIYHSIKVKRPLELNSIVFLFLPHNYRNSACTMRTIKI
jgi:hypothetical protein